MLRSLPSPLVLCGRCLCFLHRNQCTDEQGGRITRNQSKCIAPDPRPHGSSRCSASVRQGNDKQTQQRGSEYARKSVCSDKHAVSPRNENCLRGLASPVDFVQTSQTRRAYDRIGKWGSANAHRQEIVSTNNMYTHLFRKWSALISRSRNAKS